jgi:hypothetical protein
MMDWMATQSVADWRLVMAYTSAIVVRSACARMYHAARFRRDVESGMIVTTAEGLQQQRFWQRFRRAAAVAIGGYATYKGIEHASTLHAVAYTDGSIALTALGAQIATTRARRAERKRAQVVLSEARALGDWYPAQDEL